MSRMLIKEIITILKCKCALHSVNFIEQEEDWTDNNDTLDPSLFYHDKLHLIQKGNIKLSESIITATEDKILVKILISTRCQTRNIIKTYKMAASYKPNHADFPLLLNSTVSKPVSYVSSLLSFTSASRSFSNKVKDISLSLLLKTVIKLFLGPLAFVLETLH